MKKQTIFMILVALLMTNNIWAQRSSDIDGSKDYPLVKRFSGSFIEYYKEAKMIDYMIPIDFTTGKFTFQNPAKLQGNLTRIQYSTKSENTPIYILSQITPALQKEGFVIVYKADNEEMGLSPKAFNQFFYKTLKNGQFGFSYETTGSRQGFLVAKTHNGGKDIYAVIYISWFDNAALITEDVIEASSFKQEKNIMEPKDLFSVFKGAKITYYNHTKWDTYLMPAGKMAMENGANVWDKKLDLKGEVTRFQFRIDKENNAAFVYQNYLDALKNANWEIVFNGSQEEELGNTSYEWQFSMFQEGLKLEDKFGSDDDFRGGNYAYIVAKYEDNDFVYYVDLYILDKDDYTFVNEDIVKVKNPDLGMVTAKKLSEGIKKNGHMVLDGIFFETGKAVLNDKSQKALKNIAEYLNANKDKKFFIVGHSDNVGGFKDNMTLSENRAKVVMNELITKYGVDAAQLEAYGVANLAPRSSNEQESGKSKNRRVEIVLQ